MYRNGEKADQERVASARPRRLRPAIALQEVVQLPAAAAVGYCCRRIGRTITSIGWEGKFPVVYV